MAKTVVGLFDGKKEVLSQVLDDLARAGIPAEDVSTLRTTRSAVLEEAPKGMLMGGVAGLLLGAATLLVPGLGWVAIAGPIGTMLAGAALGAAAGGIITALVSKGVPEPDAHFYAEGLRRGGVLVIVHARDDDQARRAEVVMKRHGAAEVRERRDEWMRQGWKGRFEGEERAAAPVRREEEAAGTPLAAVCVYDFVIEIPAQYSGPERRRGAQPYSGLERRAA